MAQSSFHSNKDKQEKVFKIVYIFIYHQNQVHSMAKDLYNFNRAKYNSIKLN